MKYKLRIKRYRTGETVVKEIHDTIKMIDLITPEHLDFKPIYEKKIIELKNIAKKDKGYCGTDDTDIVNTVKLINGDYIVQLKYKCRSIAR